MLDNQLIIQIIAVLNNGFQAINNLVPNPPVVVQSYQPIQQGANTPPTLYLYKIGDTLLGSPSRCSVWDETTQTQTYTELQQYETQFQLSCWAAQNPANSQSLTASDLANYARYIMQSQATIETLEANNVGIYRVGQVRNQSFSDDRDRFEFAPSFDFTLTHKQIITLTDFTISETVFQIDQV